MVSFLPWRRRDAEASNGPRNNERGDEAPMTLITILVCAFASIGGIMFGYDSGYISGVLGMAAFKKQFGHQGWPADTPGLADGYMYDSGAKSLITSILSAGTFFGALLPGIIADRIGRKKTIILGCIIYIGGVVAQTVAGTVAVLTVGRAIAGVGVGIESSTVIMYISEITPSRHRGTIMSAYQFCITLGIFFASAVNYGTKDNSGSTAYRIPIGIQFLWPLILGIGIFFSAESPRWFVMNDKEDAAKKALSTIRQQEPDSTFVTSEYNELVASWNVEKEITAGWVECFTGGFRRGSNLLRTLTGVTVQMMQQLTGVNFIFYFGTTFFQGAGIENPYLISIILAAVNVVTTPISFWVMDRNGRRPTLIWGAIGMAVCEFIIAIVGVTTEQGNGPAQKVLIAFTAFFIAFFASTWGPGGWTVCGEIFPLTIRAKGIALSTASNWLWNFIIAYFTPYLVDADRANLGANVFFIWGSTCFLSALFAIFCVYETKGLSLEDANIMMNEVWPWQSSSWTPPQPEPKPLNPGDANRHPSDSSGESRPTSTEKRTQGVAVEDEGDVRAMELQELPPPPLVANGANVAGMAPSS